MCNARESKVGEAFYSGRRGRLKSVYPAFHQTSRVCFINLLHVSRVFRNYKTRDLVHLQCNYLTQPTNIQFYTREAITLTPS